MACWLYQMNAEKEYPHELYRAEVCEGATTQNWHIGESTSRPKNIHQGDLIILFFVKAGSDVPGIYGWAIVTFFNAKTEELFFRPMPYSDYLKMNPIPEAQVRATIVAIQNKQPQRTILPMTAAQCRTLRKAISKHVYG